MLNMFKFILVYFIAFSCLPAEPLYFGSFRICNNSNHSIDIKIYKSASIFDTILLPKFMDDTIVQGYYEDNPPQPPPFFADSVQVIYDDSISMTHYRRQVQAASRNILNHDNWSGGKTGKNKYEWEYIFTDEDYLEAIENQ